MDGDVCDIIAHEYYFDDVNLSKRMGQVYSNQNSSIYSFRLYGDGITSDMSVHVLYGPNSVVITADAELVVELEIENGFGNYVYDENVTISETPITISKKRLKYIVE